MAKLLLVEDEQSIAEPIIDFLSFDGHQVEHLQDGAEAILRLKLSKFDLIILDWNLPHRSGIEILRDFRNDGGQSPVLMLTAKSLIADKTMGLDNGADDYLLKPFDMRELGSRVRALLRRPVRAVSAQLVAGALMLDTEQKRCTIQNAEIMLSAKEHSLLEFLLRHKGLVYSADDLLKNIWASDSESGLDAVRQCIARLRKKINQPDLPPLLVTMVGSGYKIDG